MAQETEYLAGFNSERDVVHSAPAIESAGESVNFDPDELLYGEDSEVNWIS